MSSRRCRYSFDLIQPAMMREMQVNTVAMGRMCFCVMFKVLIINGTFRHRTGIVDINRVGKHGIESNGSKYSQRRHGQCHWQTVLVVRGNLSLDGTGVGGDQIVMAEIFVGELKDMVRTVRIYHMVVGNSRTWH